MKIKVYETNKYPNENGEGVINGRTYYVKQSKESKKSNDASIKPILVDIPTTPDVSPLPSTVIAEPKVSDDSKPVVKASVREMNAANWAGSLPVDDDDEPNHIKAAAITCLVGLLMLLLYFIWGQVSMSYYDCDLRTILSEGWCFW